MPESKPKVVKVSSGNELDDIKKRLKILENSQTGTNPRNLGGIRSKDLRQATRANFFGDKSDGDVSISGGTTTLTGNVYYDTLEIKSDGIIDTAGWKIFAQKIIGTGIIRNNGGDGGVGGNGQDSDGGAAGGAAGTAGAAAHTGGALPDSEPGKVGLVGAAGVSGTDGVSGGTGSTLHS